MLEDAGAHSIAGWATAISPGPAREASQTVTFKVTTDTASLHRPAGDRIQRDAHLTSARTPTAIATVTVTAVDNGGTANGGHAELAQTCAITVTAVNDAPRFTAGGSQSVVSLLGAQSVNDWAKGISPGPPDESAQTVTFQVSTSNGGLFAVQPSGQLRPGS